VQLIIQRLNKKYNRQVESVSREVMQKIRTYPWPGNVRELENILERSLLFTKGKEITILDLAIPATTNSAEDWKNLKESALSRVEQAYLETALKTHQGDVNKIAESMGITSRAVYGKLKKYEINLAEFRNLKT
jgi:DNA-binding NtrC family response regulator